MSQQRDDIRPEPNYSHRYIDNSIETTWYKGDIIREIATGKPYRVTHVYQHVCTIITDLTERGPLKLTYTLDPSDYDKFARDIEMQQVVKKNEMIWEHKPLPSFL